MNEPAVVIANRKPLLYAGILSLIAAGIGFAVRGGLLDIWSTKYGFTMTELGQITGGGLLGFGIVILIAGFLIDAIGYKPLMLLALLCHVVSALMLFAATPVFNSAGKDSVYMLLFWSAFIFAVGNGICEAVINPLTATLFPEQKTHYLNILHAGWPAGLVIGGLIVFLERLDRLGDSAGDISNSDRAIRLDLAQRGISENRRARG